MPKADFYWYVGLIDRLHNIELQAKDDNNSHKPPMGKVLTVICGLLVLIIFHYLSPYLPSFVGF
ncbi:hypothetical protein H5202_10620 [Shewanella sp. SG41-4]|uniref:hypothetical protein n=1 Tax=Shewanella sp. SG41-4 TaxID=2760976 RepID=UPI001600F671|nr:hypothetical protein [Shewanella sp. SG41-4]MBB1439123.1 hypothetical protein [Shewanella sp. SG41-4]